MTSRPQVHQSDDKRLCQWLVMAECRICDAPAVGIYHGLGGRELVCRDHSEMLRREWGIRTKPLEVHA